MSDTWEERHAAREAKYEELRAIAGKLIVGGFKLVPATDPDRSGYARYYSPVTMAHDDGREFWLSWRQKAGQIHVSAHLPNEMHHFQPYNTTTPSINVSASKTPIQISRDIARRLLPKYTALYIECRAKLNASNAYKALSDRNIREVAKAFNAEVRLPPHSDEQTINSVSWYRTNSSYGDAKASGDRIELHLRGLTVSEAKKIAALLDQKK
jgi:hypothetical protein